MKRRYYAVSAEHQRQSGTAHSLHMSYSSKVRGYNGPKLICGRFQGEAGGQVEEGRWVQLATDLETHISKKGGKSIETLLQQAMVG